jgi:TPR repeat protein
MSKIYRGGVTVMVSRLTMTLALCWLGAAAGLGAAPTKAEREVFAQTKAKAEKGDIEAEIQLATCYANGVGVTRSRVKAAKWHRQAAEAGSARGQYLLGLDYTEGFGVVMDADEAFGWYLKAAQQGLVEAQVSLGRCYVEGEGVSANPVEGVRWLRKAAEQEPPQGKYELGKCYFEGRGVTQDPVEGLKWVLRAAEGGYGLAQARVGLCYVTGEAVAKDLVAAYKWYCLAAAQEEGKAGDARIELARVEAQMTKEQIAEGQRLAREFKPGKPSAPDAQPGTAAMTQTNAPGSPVATTGPVGYVSVKADDEGGEVFVDGAFVGNPPARLKLAEGRHVIEVKKSGFKVYRREVTVGADSDLNLRVVLEKE